MKFENKDTFNLTLGNRSLSHSLGFDPAANFLLLPRGGARGLLVKGGKGLSPQLSSTGTSETVGITKFDTGRDLEIWVNGRVEGSYDLTIPKSPAPVKPLTLNVVRQRIVKTGFYDTSYREGGSTTFNENLIKPLIERVNRIFEDQTNVQMQRVGVFQLHPVNLPDGRAVDIDKNGGDFAINTIDDAEYHVYFVWGIAGKPKANGITKGPVTLLDVMLDPDKMAVTLAHEFGHFCSTSGPSLNSHDTDANDLMFDKSPHGIMIRKGRQDRIRR